MALTKVKPHADHKRSGAEFRTERAADGDREPSNFDSKFYEKRTGDKELHPQVANEGPRNTSNFADGVYRDRGTEYHQHSAKTDGMCK